MGLKHITVAMALFSSAFAAPRSFPKRADCQADYQGCISSGAAEVVCQCDLLTCSGEDSQRLRDYCSSAISALPYPSATSIPGGCNPAHPGSCPTTTAAFTSISGIPGGCNPAHPGSCPTTTSAAAPAETTYVSECEAAYSGCLASGAAEVVCQCDLAVCTGEDSQRIRDFCATATASLPYPSATSIPGGCNPAHPGSCPSTTLDKAVFTSIPGIPGGCNPAHPGSCPSTTAAFTSISGIPGGCNPAHPGSCPSTTLTTAVFTSIPGIPGGCNPAHPGSCPTTTPAAVAGPAGAASTPTPIAGLTWTINNMTRYCSSDNSGCDYNFVISTPSASQVCSVSRMPGSSAATESWSNAQCEKSDFFVSWGYVEQPAPAFAVITIVEGKELAWFGISDVNGGEVTVNAPFGSGSWAQLGPEQVYTY